MLSQTSKIKHKKAKANTLFPFRFSLFPLAFSLFAFPCFLFSSSAQALPGQTTDAATAWINANPTLRPAIGDGLRVVKNSTPAQQFTFQASVLPPGRIVAPPDRSIIRSERMTFYDKINGVTLDRLKESLRAIYGPAIYQDFERAQLVYDYPTPQVIDLGRRQNRRLVEQQQGELRLGERFGYWIEITKTDTGKAFNGRITVFLKEDLGKLQAELRDR
jgi:hypothetical protein